LNCPLKIGESTLAGWPVSKKKSRTFQEHFNIIQ